MALCRFLQFLVRIVVGIIFFDKICRGLAGTLSGQASTTMWLDGYHHCSSQNMSLPSPNSTNISSYSYPVWTFGLVVTRIYTDGQDSITIMSMPANKQAWVCCTKDGKCQKVGDTQWNYSQATDNCSTRNESLFNIQGDNAHKNNFGIVNWFGYNYWAGDVNISSLFTVRNMSSQCILVYDGALVVDDCNNKHAVICVEEEAMPTFYLHRKNETERFPAYKPKSSTPSAGTTTKHSDSSFQPTTAKGTSSGGPTLERNHTNNVTNKQGDKGIIFTPDIVYTIAGVGAFLVIVMVIVAICCCCRRKREKSNDAVVFDAYSEAQDSIVFKEKDDHTVYAVPDDALNAKKAKPRSSISEDEYDVLKMDSAPDKAKQPHTGNVYSHITLGPKKKNQMASTDVVDDTYDVTNNKGSVITTRNDVGNDTYEHLETPKR